MNKARSNCFGFLLVDSFAVDCFVVDLVDFAGLVGS
jgi:hypothetical protein